MSSALTPLVEGGVLVERKSVAEGFRYASDTNPAWLTNEAPPGVACFQ